MASPAKVTKGYVKTENMLLFLLVAVAVGFVSGVVFSAYRSPPVPDVAQNMPQNTSGGTAPMTAQQKQTLAALVQATQATPENIKVWTQLGHFYFDVGLSEKAIQAYEKSLALDGSRPDVWTDLGVMYRRSGDADKAIASFDRAISLNRKHEIARFNKGVVLMHDKNDPKGALETWERLLEINPQAKTPSGDPLKTMVEQLKKNSPS